MATVNLGRIGFVNKGTYNGATAYKINDVVNYNNSVYASVQAGTGQIPTNTAYWKLWIDSALLAPLASPALTTPTINGIAQSGYSGFKNHIINGDFQVNQRADIDTAPVAMVSTAYQIDRTKNISSLASTLQRLSGQSVGGRYVKTFKTVASTTVSGTLGHSQFIEDYHKGETVTFSVWVKSNNINARLSIYDGITYTWSNPHTGGGGWELLKVTQTISSSATQLRCTVYLISSNGNYVNITTGDYIESTMWQLESGTVATPFEQRPYGLELSLCQRYYEVTTASCSSSLTASVSGYVPLKYLVEKRVVPTVVKTNGTQTNGGFIPTQVQRDSLTMATATSINGFYREIGFILSISAEL